MVEFFNDMLACYKLFVNWLFSYKIGGFSAGVFILACMVFSIIGYYLVRRFL